MNGAKIKDWGPLGMVGYVEAAGYSINEQGEVYNLKGKKLKMYKGFYYEFTVYVKGGKKRRCSLHRLLALKFIPTVEGKLYINHIDANKYNNALSNLEWCTWSENYIHAHRLGLMHRWGVKATEAAAEWHRKILLDTSTGVYYRSINEAAALYGMGRATLSDMLRGVQPNKTNLIYA